MKSKSVFIVIAILILTAIIGMMLPRVKLLFEKHAAGDAVLSFIPSGPIAATEGTQFNVQVALTRTSSTVRAVDVVVNFDKNKLSLTGIDDTARMNGNASFKTFVPIVTGQTSGVLDSNTVMANANASGKVEFGAVTYDYAGNQNSPTFGVTPGFASSTSLVLATLKFTPKTGAVGNTNITFDYTAGTTTDSNVVDDGEISGAAPYLNDVLGSVSPASGIVVNISGTVSVEPTVVVTPATPTLSGVKFKMDSLTASGVVRNVTVSLKNSSGIMKNFTANATSGTGGVFTVPNLTLTGINPGTYTVYVKDNTHLRKNLGSLAIVSGTNAAPNWSALVVKAGDFTNNNVMNLEDITQFLNNYSQLEYILGTNDPKAPYDVDGNGKIDFYDLGVILSNYVQIDLNGDN